MFAKLWFDLVSSDGLDDLSGQVQRGSRDQVPAHQVELGAIGVEDAASSLADDDGTYKQGQEGCKTRLIRARARLWRSY